jgi:predicted ATPase
VGWRITLLGKICAVREEKTLSRFESSRAVALLARLVLFPQRSHPREELCEYLWPDVEPEIGRRRLRHLLGTLRSPLEDGLPTGSVLIADRNAVRINPDAVTTDVAEFERALRRRDFDAAKELYVGELLPGLYDDWIVEERLRLEALVEALAEGLSMARTTPPSTSQARPERDRVPLPPYLTAFFGRESEREMIAAQLMRSRLVTITGLGGTGKTRLAVEILRAQASHYDHAAFVSLAECVAAEQIPLRLRAALGLPVSDADPLAQVCWHLSEATTLLILDNFEQLVDADGTELVETLLARVPGLTLLISSRRALGISGERLFPLPCLPEDDALALFLDRVQASRPGFHLTEGNRSDMEAVCRGLEGIPLALELAATRIRAFTPAEMRRELTRRFDWVVRTGLKGKKDDRHRSLAATLEWSWRLLPPRLQVFLSHLALFRAPFSVDAAVGVTGYPDARELLEALEGDSLVQSQSEDSDVTRYTLLETVREFALARIETPEVARSRFRAYYLAHPTHDENTATAWHYALQDSNKDDAYAFALLPNADWTGRIGVARTRAFLERTCALPCDYLSLKLHTTNLLAECLSRNMDRQGAVALMETAVAPLEAVGGELLAEGLKFQALIGFFASPPETTLHLLERCLSITKDSHLRAEVLRIKASLFCQTPNFDSAEPLFDEAERLYPPDVRGRRLLLVNRAHLARERGQYEEALRLCYLATEQAMQVGDTALVRMSQNNLPDILSLLGRWEEAIAEGRRCTAREDAIGDRVVLLGVVWNLAVPFLKIGEVERAVKLQAATAVIWDREVSALSEQDKEDIKDFRAELAHHLDEDTISQLWSEGESLTLKETLALVQ